MYSYWSYILASKPHGTLYIGVTNNLIARIEQHRAGIGSAFTRKYGVHLLVWYEEFTNVEEAIQREKTIKHYVRAWKINLIERTNPHWIDLYPSLPGVAPVPTLVLSRTMGPRDKREDDTGGCGKGRGSLTSDQSPSTTPPNDEALPPTLSSSGLSRRSMARLAQIAANLGATHCHHVWKMLISDESGFHGSGFV